MLGYLKNSYLTNEQEFQNPGEVLFIQKDISLIILKTIRRIIKIV